MRSSTTPRRRAGMTLATLVAATVVGTAAGTAQGATGAWQDGTHDEDTVIDCITGLLSTGVSAQVGWRTDDGQVPEVGERFYLRAYAGLVSMPCSDGVLVIPEVLLPAGATFDEDTAHPVLWDVVEDGTTPQLSSAPLGYARGRNGGLAIGTAAGEAFQLGQGDYLEIQIPIKATRVLKGIATQQPECEDRREGRRPCPVDQAGDHLQVAFTVDGHGGDKSYVTPYVGLFAQAPSSPHDGGVTTRASSTTRASFRPSRSGRGRAVVKVASSAAVTGTVVMRDRRTVIGRATVSAGRAVVRLQALGRGKHVLTAAYSGSATVAPSTSRARKVTLR